MTIVDIWNLALQLCGNETVILTVDDVNKATRLCRTSYDQARRALLQRHPWKFAAKRVIVDLDTSEVPAFGYSGRYLLPDDYIRVITIDEDWQAQWTREGRYILYSSGAAIKLRYVVDESDIEKFDPLFISALVAELASLIVYPLTQSNERRNEVTEAAKLALRHAKRANAIEQAPQSLDATYYEEGRLNVR